MSTHKTHLGKEKDEILHILQERSRDNARTPMQWDDSEYAGFSDQKPWLALGKQAGSINVRKDLASEDSIFAFYKKLIELRKTMKVIQKGIYVPLLENDPNIFAYERKLENKSLICINNFFGHNCKADIDLSGYELLLSNYPDRTICDSLEMRPYETIILYRRS